MLHFITDARETGGGENIIDRFTDAGRFPEFFSYLISPKY
jgi:hypothetical protein